MVLQVYSEKESPRLDYTLDLLLRGILNLKYTLVGKDSELDTKFPILNYSNKDIIGAFQIIPHTLLFENIIQQQRIELNQGYCLFNTGGTGLDCDIFASSFYMVTRYEEYLPSDLDDHARFKAEQSLAYQNNFLQKAVVNAWADKLKKELKKQFPQLKFVTKNYKYLSTIDIDHPYAYKGKSITRLLGGFVKAILRNDRDDIKARLSYVFLGKKDPFDVYEQFSNLHKKYFVESLFFFLIGEKGAYDKNIDVSKKVYKKLIRQLSTDTNVGIHPSYQSNQSYNVFHTETKKLQCTIGKQVENSRQHFLKLSFPETYQRLIKYGISNDFSMGFASQVGFRAGICSPFSWFDLSQNVKTKLEIIPFQVMDGTLNDYLKLSPNEALNLVRELKKEVESHNGLFVTLWHNESLSGMRQWKGWETVYQEMLSFVSTPNKSHID